MNIEDKLNLLRDLEEVTEESYNKTIQVLRLLNAKGFDMMNKGEMFLIHLVKALVRIEKGLLEVADADILQEIEANHLNDAKDLLASIEDEIQINFETGEREYILLYLSMIVSNQ